jgi:hypothetical protein
LIADRFPPRLSVRAKTLDVGWLLKRPISEPALLRAVSQAWLRWNADYIS